MNANLQENSTAGCLFINTPTRLLYFNEKFVVSIPKRFQKFYSYVKWKGKKEKKEMEDKMLNSFIGSAKRTFQ